MSSAGHLAGEPVAFFQDLVDLVDRPLAESGRPADAQGAPALRTALFFGPGPPEREAHGLARDVLQCIGDGEETADQRPGIDGAVVDVFSSTTGAGAGACDRRNKGIRGS